MADGPNKGNQSAADKPADKAPSAASAPPKPEASKTEASKTEPPKPTAPAAETIPPVSAAVPPRPRPASVIEGKATEVPPAGPEKAGPASASPAPATAQKPETRDAKPATAQSPSTPPSMSAKNEPKNETKNEPNPVAPAPARTSSPLVPALLGGVVGGIVVAGAFWALRPAGGPDLSPRIAALEQQLARAEEAARAASAKADALTPRIGQIETAAGSAASAAAQARTEAGQALQAARSRPAATGAPAPAMPDIGPLETRLGALESRLPQIAAAANQPPPAPAAPPALSRAVLAQTLASDLERGRALGPLLTRLEGHGADAASLAPLRPFAQTPAPTARQLIDQFAPLAGALAVGDGPAGADAQLPLGERLWKAATRIVRVRPVTAAGDDPASLVGRIELGLASGSFDEALDNWKRLPEPSRQLSADFGARLEARAAADAAARKIVQDALAALPAPGAAQ